MTVRIDEVRPSVHAVVEPDMLDPNSGVARLFRIRGLTQRDVARLSTAGRAEVDPSRPFQRGPLPPDDSVGKHPARLASALQLSIEEILSSPHAGCQLFSRGSL